MASVVIGVLSAAHPHSRGENTQESTRPPTRAGSSPLTRGKLCDEVLSRERSRLIPTHAGKTPKAGADSPRRRAHPHSRGENEVIEGTGSPILGSSPLTRGKLERGSKLLTNCGLIPTHAGKTTKR